MTSAIPRLETQREEDPLTRYSPQLFWQKRDKARQEQQTENQDRDKVNPVAGSLGVDLFLQRLQPIKDIGAKAAAGQIVSSNIQKERQQQIAARKAEEARQAAYNQALANMRNFTGQPGFGAVNYSGNVGGGAVQWDRSAAGVADLMRAVGFPESAIAEGIAISRAESGWREDAINNKNRNGSIDQGLWQINTIHRGEAWYPKNLNDPLESTRAAFELWKRRGGSWGDWSVYNSGAYRQYLQNVPAPRIVSQTVTVGNQTVATASGQLRMTAVQKAQAYANSGVGYVWGGNNLATGVDCSGLVQQVYRQLGLNLPRTAQQQAFYGTRAPISSLQVGDLVAWNNGASRGIQVGHIAVYAGNGQIIESYQRGLPARRRNLTAKEINSGLAWGVKIRFPGE